MPLRGSSSSRARLESELERNFDPPLGSARMRWRSTSTRCAHDMHVTLTLTHDASRAPLGEATRLGSLGSLRSSRRLERLTTEAPLPPRARARRISSRIWIEGVRMCAMRQLP